MGPSVRTRRVTRDEWERVRELRLRALAVRALTVERRAERVGRVGEVEWVGWIEGWSGSRNVLFVAEDGERWVGMAVGSRAGDEPDAHLYGMWVEPSRRSSGIGASLVEQVLGWARARDVRSVILGVTETNAGAAAFYEQLGFADTGERDPLREGSELRVRVFRREL